MKLRSPILQKNFSEMMFNIFNNAIGNYCMQRVDVFNDEPAKFLSKAQNKKVSDTIFSEDSVNLIDIVPLKHRLRGRQSVTNEVRLLIRISKKTVAFFIKWGSILRGGIRSLRE